MKSRLLLACLLLLGVQAVRAQMIIIPEPPLPAGPGLFQLELRQLTVHTQLVNESATTELDQVFFNPTAHQLQGYYYYPIPKDASIQDFTMWINGKETKGELLTADKARQIYEEILRKFQDPALLEYMDQGLLRMRVFPIQPQSEQRIKLTYRHSLPVDQGMVSYQLPLSSHNKTVREFAIDVDIRTAFSLKAITCPAWQAAISRKSDTEALVSFEKENVLLDKDFKLLYHTSRDELGASLLSYADGGTDCFFQLQISPGLSQKTAYSAKDIAFVVDVSGSMTGEKLEQAKRALAFCVDHLNEGDRFNIIRFSTEANALFTELKDASQASRQDARKFVESMDAIGGTNIDEALQLAFRQKTSANRPFFVIFLTDGKPTIGETNTDALLKKAAGYNGSQTRVFTFGIGTELNTRLLDLLTESTRGYRTYILPEEDIELAVSSFYSKVSHPVLTDVEYSVEGVKVKDCYPKKLPDLFRGEILTLTGLYDGNGPAKVILKGKVNGQTLTHTFNVDFAKQATQFDFIPPLWGARAVGYLLDQIRLNGESKELVDEVVRLSKKYGIITPYTSYLIIEDESQLIGGNVIRRDQSVLAPRVSEAERPAQSGDYDRAMKQHEGPGSVEASKEIQTMANSTNLDDMQSESSEELAADIRFVQGRAVYLNQGQWLDSYVADKASRQEKFRVNRIQFNSPEYFQLLKDKPQSADFLALGNNVQFVLEDEVYWVE